MNRGIKSKVKAWVYTRVLGDLTKQWILLFGFTILATPIVVMQQTMCILMPILSEEKGVIVRFSEHVTSVLIVIIVVCIATQVYKMIGNKNFCLGLIVIAFTAAISCYLYKQFLVQDIRYSTKISLCAIPYLISIVVVGFVYRHIWKIIMS